MPPDSTNPLLSVRDLCVHYPVERGFLQKAAESVKAVNGISFDIARGMTLGLVGESGSGKSTTGKAIVQLAAITSGSIRYQDTNISELNNRDFLPFRKKIQMIFQDPYNSLNPRLTIFQIISEALNIHFPSWPSSKQNERVAALLDQVGLSADAMARYPHEFSGGQRQRIGIARALAVEPELIICDEPVSALDVSVQAQIINLLQDLQKELNLTYLFIAHDLAVVEHISDRVIVMTEGKIVEEASAHDICHNPQHPYTQKLLAAVPQL